MIPTLAGIVVFLHLAAMLVEACGAIAAIQGRYRQRPLRLWHSAYLGIVLVKAIAFLTVAACPLTMLEQHLRAQLPSGSAWSGTFIEHYLPFIPTEVDLVASIALLAIGAAAWIQVLIPREISSTVTPRGDN